MSETGGQWIERKFREQALESGIKSACDRWHRQSMTEEVALAVCRAALRGYRMECYVTGEKTENAAGKSINVLEWLPVPAWTLTEQERAQAAEGVAICATIGSGVDMLKPNWWIDETGRDWREPKPDWMVPKLRTATGLC